MFYSFRLFTGINVTQWNHYCIIGKNIKIEATCIAGIFITNCKYSLVKMKDDKKTNNLQNTI